VIYIYGTKGCQFCDKAKKTANDMYGEYKFLDIGLIMTKDIKISEEKKKYIYESPDKGKTVFAREFGQPISERKLIKGVKDER